MTPPPPSRITGIHHLTAVSSDAQRTGDFYTRVLGKRLVKQTVNFDGPSSSYLSFHDPGGHLLEIATDTPGFTVDKSIDQLGRRLRLPHWLEAGRNEIEQLLTPLSVSEPIGR